MSERDRLPELLCPAGTPAALDAAIDGGADAVYLGGTVMNARLHAGNFTPEQLRDAVRRAHRFGVRVYITLNTLVTDRELPAFLDAAREAARAGADALIVADPGGAALIRRALPGMELHASTQMSGHNALMGAELQRLGFSRMVAARELSAADLRSLAASSPIETEIFVHGALCVSHSGQCLFSSLVGGRSGNRGECAQPCRLPYCPAGSRAPQGRLAHPLSLRDLSLAAHLPELLEMGIASFKIEGRMKSPEYVRDTARIWRRLLDERRAATPAEMQQLAAVFSRGGFTDGYFTGRLGTEMLGTRRSADKRASRLAAPFAGLQRRMPLRLHAVLRAGEPALLTLSDGRRSVTVAGDCPQPARTAPLTAQQVLHSLCRMGGTVYRAEASEADVDLSPGLMLPVSCLNALRRQGLDALEAACAAPAPEERPAAPLRELPGTRRVCRTARFRSPGQIPSGAVCFFDRISLPLPCFAGPEDADPAFERVSPDQARVFRIVGAVLPPVITDSALPAVRRMLARAREAGVRYATVGNPGHLAPVREAGLVPLGDFRLNVTNRESAALYASLGFEELLLSPELTLPQLRDIGGSTAVLVYGRVPLMTLERCVIRDLASCESCRSDRVALTDRMGVSFPVLREWEHRNVVCNSLPTAMTDRAAVLERYGLTNRHYLFTTESREEVMALITADAAGRPLPFPVRRIPS